MFWQKISKKELIQACIISVCIILLSLIPTIYGYAHTPTGKVFTAIRLNNYSDTNSYLSWIEQAREGHFLFKQLFSSEHQPAIFFHPTLLITGWVANLLNVSNILAYHIVRCTISLGLLLVIYNFISYFVDQKTKRLWVFVIVSLASGFGWMINSSQDLTQIEATNFLSLHESLLNPFSVLLMVVIFTIFLQSSRERYISKKSWSIIICAINFLILNHPYDFIVVFFVLGTVASYELLRLRNMLSLRVVLYLSIFSFPALFWQMYVLNKNTVIGIWATFQTAVPAAGNIANYLFGGGLSLLFLFVSLLMVFTKKQRKLDFLIIWIAASVFLLFNPFSDRFQQKLSIGLPIPFFLMAAIGLFWWLDEFLIDRMERYRNIIAAVTVTLMCLTSLWTIFLDTKTIRLQESPVYVNMSFEQAQQWIKQYTPEHATVLAAYEFSNAIPAHSGHTVYLGHYDQTVNFDLKYQATLRLLSAKIGYRDPLKLFVAENDIRYIVIDEEVRSWGGFDASGRDYLELAYSNEDVQIYKVK